MLESRGGLEVGQSRMVGDGLELLDTDEGLVLTDGVLTLRGDLTRMIRRVKQGNLQRELLVRAARIKGADRRLRAVDATAGLGEDALLLAAAGFEVDLFERNPIIAALLQDTLRRAAGVSGLAEAVSRMHFHEGDSISALSSLGDDGTNPDDDTSRSGGNLLHPDVIYLDPMFPARQKSAAVKKKFQLLHKLEGPCEDQEELLQAALDAHPRKIVVKRPLKAPCLAGVKPAYELSGKEIRYDCIVLPQ